MPVRQLPETVINRIAAGEVVERPASVVKELVENALDAGASRIDIFTEGGGRRLIRITDDGGGMTQPDLALAVDRHATSKLADDDLLRIRTLGFAAKRCRPSARSRGWPSRRAMPASRMPGRSNVDGGQKSAMVPAALPTARASRSATSFMRRPRG